MTNDQRLATNDRFPHHSFLNPLLKQLTLKNALHEHAGRMNHVGIEFSRFDEVLDFRDGNLRGGRHHRIEVARRLAISQVAPLVALPCLDESEVGSQRAFHDVGAAIEFARLLSVSDCRAYTSRSKESGDAGATGANPLGKRSLRNQVELHRSI